MTWCFQQPAAFLNFTYSTYERKTCWQVAKGTLPPTLALKPVNLSIRTRAEGDFAAGYKAVNPKGSAPSAQAPAFGATADSTAPAVTPGPSSG